MMEVFPLDTLDQRIVSALQDSGRLSYEELGSQVGLSASAALRRVRRLEDAGVIAGYVALVSAKQIGLGLTAYINVRVEKNRGGDKRSPMDDFAAAVQTWPRGLAPLQRPIEPPRPAWQQTWWRRCRYSLATWAWIAATGRWPLCNCALQKGSVKAMPKRASWLALGSAQTGWQRCRRSVGACWTCTVRAGRPRRMNCCPDARAVKLNLLSAV